MKTMEQKQIKLRDLRRKEKFQIDDEYLNGYAKHCGWQATLVYNSLCRHADKDQYSFPSIKHIAEQHGVGRNTVMKGIKSLKEWGIINVIEQGRTGSGIWKCNGYELIDKSEWRQPSPSSKLRTESSWRTPPSPSGKPDGVPVEDTKDTHIKDTHIKESNADALQDEEIINFIGIFKGNNPSYERMFGNTTERRAAGRIIKKFGAVKARATAEYAVSISGKQYAPVITTPYQLERNLGKLIAYYNRENVKRPALVEI